MVASRAGLANLGLDGFVRACLLQCALLSRSWLIPILTKHSHAIRTEYYFMLNTAEPPIFYHPRPVKQLTYPRHPFSEEVCKLISTMAVGFTELAVQSHISIETVCNIANITKWQRLVARQTSHKDLRPVDLRFVLDYEPWEIINDLNFCLQCLPQGKQSQCFERALCTALIIYIHIALDKLINKLPWTAAYKRLGNELTAFVQDYTPESEERNCLIWIRILIMAWWREQSGPTPEGVDMISEMVRGNVIDGSSWAELEIIFYQFLWNEEMGRYCRTFWEEATWKCTGQAAAFVDAQTHLSANLSSVTE